MKLLEFKRAITKRWKILGANTVFTSKESLAYSANNWGSLLSTISYISTYLIFVEAIFNKTDTIASFSKNEMLFLTVIGQTVYLLTYFVSFANVNEMVNLVKNGGLDLLLIKPLPHLFYVSIKKIDLPATVLNVMSSVLPPLVYLIIRGGVKLQLINIGLGVGVILMGMICVHCYQFILNLFVFWQPKAKSINRISYDSSFWGINIPYEGFPQILRIVCLTIIPCLVPIGLAVSIMLGKIQNGWQWLGYATFLAIGFGLLKIKMWQKALVVYQSASS